MSPLLMYLSVSFVAALLISNVIANHMLRLPQITLGNFSIGPWPIDAGALTFPITYIISDVLSEVYGYKWSRRVAWTSLAINAVFALIVISIVRLPSPDFYDGTHFTNALSNTWRIVLASLVAYCVGDLVDDRIFRHLRKKSREKFSGEEKMRGFAFRALVSSLAGHILDTTIFVFIAFAPVTFLTDTEMPWDALPRMIIVGIIIKWAYEWAIIPVTYRVTKWVNQKEDAYENSRNGQQ
jgi:hypothetical protein